MNDEPLRIDKKNIKLSTQPSTPASNYRTLEDVKEVLTSHSTEKRTVLQKLNKSNPFKGLAK